MRASLTTLLALAAALPMASAQAPPEHYKEVVTNIKPVPDGADVNLLQKPHAEFLDINNSTRQLVNCCRNDCYLWCNDRWACCINNAGGLFCC